MGRGRAGARALPLPGPFSLLVFTLLAASVVWLAAPGGVLAQVDRGLYDRWLRVADRSRHELGRNVLLVTAAAARVDGWRLGEPGARRDLAELLRRIRAAGPAAIVIEPVLDGDADDDEVLATACRAARPVLLRVAVHSPRPTEYTVSALPERLRGVVASGYVLWERDDDGVVRRFGLGLPTGVQDSLATVARVEVKGSRPSALAPDAEVLLRFQGPPGEGFARVTTEQTADLARLAPGRVVVLGSTETAGGGYITPLSVAARPGWRERRPVPMSSTELLANAIETVFSGRPPVESGGWQYPLALLAALGGVWFAQRRNRRQAIAWLGFLVVGWSLAVLFLLTQAGVLLPWCEPLVAAALAFLLAVAQRLLRHLDELIAAAETAEAERRRLEELDMAKRAVLCTIVHDLKSPVAVIKGQAATLASDPERELGHEVHQEFLESIGLQCDRLANLVEDLLDVDPERKLTLVLESTDLALLVRQVLDLYQLTSRRHDLELEIGEGIGHARVLVDSEKLRRILGNLVGNAIKYSPDGGGVVVRIEREGDELVLAVTDHGIGMTQEQLGRLFGLFVRVLDDPERIPGTGIGLYSVRRLVEAQGGRIEVASEPGRGSTFTCRLPMPAATEATGERV
jgi:signal transduction histidine kinase